MRKVLIKSAAAVRRQGINWKNELPCYAYAAAAPHRSDALAGSRDPPAPGSLIYPLFLCPGEGVRKPIGSMPGVFNLSVDEAVKEAERWRGLESAACCCSACRRRRTSRHRRLGRRRHRAEGLRALKRIAGSIRWCMMADVCLCEYTSHGHCGIVARDGDIRYRERRQLELLAKTAASLAQGGSRYRRAQRHDGWPRGGNPRALDEDGTAQTPILSYASKFASAFYGPVPRGGGFGAAVRRPQKLPDGRRERCAKPCARSSWISPRVRT